METSVDPSAHLALINRVANQMNLYGDMREEAFSEGLVLITEASQSFDPAKGPLVNWLANNIRWGLMRWIARQKETLPINKRIATPQKPVEYALELAEAVNLARKTLTPTEYEVLMYNALEYKGVSIARKLGISPVQVSRLKKRAQEKMRKANGIY